MMKFLTPSCWLVATVLTASNSKYHAATANEASSVIGLRGLKKTKTDKSKHSPNNEPTFTVNSDCIIQVTALLQIPSAKPLLEDEVFDCTMDPADVPGGFTGHTRKIAMGDAQKKKFKQMWKEGKLIPGESKLKLAGEGVQFDGREIKIPEGLDVESKVDKRGRGNRGNSDHNNSDNTSKNDLFTRRLATITTGDKPILVVKVTDSEGKARAESPKQIGDDIFGTNGDLVNLKSQLSACSMGQLNVLPGVPEHVLKYVDEAPGVIDITIDIPLTSGNRYTIRNAVTEKVEIYLDVTLPGPYQQVMYVLEGCYEDCGWAAYAFVDSWLSVYQGNYYKHVGVQVHELGHNFGLAHSGGLDGQTYTDHTGMMGNPLYSDDIGRMCYNAAKNWQIGWYEGRKEIFYPTDVNYNIAPNWSQSLTMVGIADYNNIPDIPVVLKLETRTSDDYFVGFNRATGVNNDNDEADDMVTIVRTGGNGNSYSQSYLQGYLAVGEEFQIDNFGGSGTDIIVRLTSIDKTTTVWKANVWVGAGTTGGPVCGDKVPLRVNVITDNYPSETSWTLTNECSGIAIETELEGDTYCVPPAKYTFEIRDSYGDGICCSYGSGSYSVKYDGVIVASGGEFENSDSVTFGGSCGPAPTNPPTPPPTSFPTKSPTDAPSPSPTTKSPSGAPSSSPTTKSPTKSPSGAPSPSPTTESPTKSPTDAPSSSPTTKSPTKSPSGAPSSSPTTMSPTKSPTSAPSSSPTSLPTKSPTDAPSSSPTTKSPTKSPSGAPSSSPTTQSPTKSPTSAPSPSPTTESPTKSPTHVPSSSPTTKSPTKSPSGAPSSSSPTQSLTDIPTSARLLTNTPTDRPTVPPTNVPTKSPTTGPTYNPTAPPTDVPTTSPTVRTGGPVVAAFDSTLNAPKCSAVGTSCTASELLLEGKSNNKEPNGSNTLDSCADGYRGSYHGDESIDTITVSAVGGGNLQAGARAEIKATVYAWDDGSQDTADFYYATDVNNPVWTLIGSLIPSGGGLRTLTVEYTLPDSDSAVQAARVNFRWTGTQGGSSGGTCSGGRYDDVDDIVFTVAAAAAGGLVAASPMEPDPVPSMKPQKFRCQSLNNSKERCGAASSACHWKRGKRGKPSGCHDKKNSFN